MGQSSNPGRGAERLPLKLARRWRRPDAVLVVLVGVLAAGLWGFIALADAVNEGSTTRLDTRMLLAMRNPADLKDPLGPGWVEEIGRDFTALGGVAVLTALTFATAGYLLVERKGHMAVFLLATIIGGTLAGYLLKHGYSRPRPDLVPHGSIVYTSSFPSGHSMMSALTYLTLAALLARVHRHRRAKLYLLAVAVLLTLAVGISRVYLGVHWPTDVLAGWTAGAGWALLCWLAARWLQQRGQIERAGLDVEKNAGAQPASDA